MKQFTRLLLALFFVAFSAAASAEIVIKFAHVVSEDTPKGRGAELFRELVEQRLAGKARVEIYPNSQLYDDDEVLKALVLGDVQLAAPSVSKFGKYTRKYGVFDLPFLFKDPNAVACFTEGAQGRALLDAMKKKGFKGLGYWLNGMKQISANRPLRRPEDAAGQKFRIMTSDVLQAQFEVLDANPQKMAFSEVYGALQTGVIDGQENTWSNIYSKKLFEVQKHFTESNHGVLEYLLLTSARFWDGLPADVRAELEAILQEVTAQVTTWALEMAAADRARIVASGKTEIILPSAEDLEAWRIAMRPVWDRFEEEIGGDVIAAVQQCNG